MQVIQLKLSRVSLASALLALLIMAAYIFIDYRRDTEKDARLQLTVGQFLQTINNNNAHLNSHISGAPKSLSTEPEHESESSLNDEAFLDAIEAKKHPESGNDKIDEELLANVQTEEEKSESRLNVLQNVLPPSLAGASALKEMLGESKVKDLLLVKHTLQQAAEAEVADTVLTQQQPQAVAAAAAVAAEEEEPQRKRVEIVSQPRKLPARATRFGKVDDVVCHADGSTGFDNGACKCREGYTGVHCSIPLIVAASSSKPVSMFTPREKRRRIVECIMFNMEVDMLDVRLHELDDAVDVFVIIESRVTHHNDPRKLILPDYKERFAKFMDKIIYVVVNSVPGGMGPTGWGVQDALRSAMDDAVRAIEDDLESDDMIFYADLDEVISHDVMNFFRDHDGFPSHVCLDLRWSYYGFLYRNPRNNKLCMGTTLENYKALGRSHAQLRNPPYHASPDRVLSVGSYEHPAGWHCSWCFPVVEFVTKLNSASTGDGTRWGDFAEKKALPYLQENKRLGRWFDGSADGKFTTPEAEPLMAPEWTLSQRDGPLRYLFERDVYA